MCFAPQRRALFRHLNCQKWSGAGVFCTFWLQNVLRATTACTFSTSQLPKVVRSWCVLYILTSKCASRHNGVQFFISHLATWLRTRRFSEPTFRPSGATNHWKNTVNRDFPTFSRICIFFLLTLSLLWPSLFCDPSHLYFSSVHIVGSLTSKLPSIIHTIHMKHNYHTYHTYNTKRTCHTYHTYCQIKHTIPNRLTYHTSRPYNTNHSWHTIPTIHSKHAIPDRPYTPYIPYPTYHTTPPPHHRGRGIVLWLKQVSMAGGRGGGLERWTIYMFNYSILYIYTVKNKVRMRFWLRVMVARLAPPPRQTHSNWRNTCKYAETQLECGARIGKKM